MQAFVFTTLESAVSVADELTTLRGLPEAASVGVGWTSSHVNVIKHPTQDKYMISETMFAAEKYAEGHFPGVSPAETLTQDWFSFGYK